MPVNSASSSSRSQDAAYHAIECLAKHTAAGQSELRQGQLSNQRVIKSLATSLQTTKDELTTSLNTVADNLTSRLVAVEEQQVKSARQTANADFKRGMRGHILPYMHHLFDGRDGNSALIPVELTDHRGLERELCCFYLPAAERFFAEECQNKIDAMTVRSFLTGPDFIRATGLNYQDVINIFLLTGFKFLAVGKGWNQERKRNTERVVIVEGKWYKQLLADIDREMPDRPKVRDFVQGGRMPNYRNDGVDYGFRRVSNVNTSTGNIVQIGGPLSHEKAKKCVVIGEPYVQEWYTPFVKDLFGVPRNKVMEHHIVSSAYDPTSAAPIGHEVAAKKYRMRKKKLEWKLQDRKKKRAMKEQNKAPAKKRSKRI